MVGFSYLSVRNAFLGSPWTVLSIKYKLDCEHSFARKSVSESISAAKSRKLQGRECERKERLSFRSYSRPRNSRDFAARILSLTDFRAKETARRINTGWELKALLFRSMGRCESSFDMTACQALVQSQFQKKKRFDQPINELVCVSCSAFTVRKDSKISYVKRKRTLWLEY